MGFDLVDYIAWVNHTYDSYIACALCNFFFCKIKSFCVEAMVLFVRPFVRFIASSLIISDVM